MEQMHVSKNNQRTLSQEEAEQMKEESAEQVGKTVTDHTVELEDIDEILDAIDEVLEENAEAFVNSFHQKNGE